MFSLSKKELRRAKKAIEHHGYSTMLPDPLEPNVLSSHWQEIRNQLGRIDLEDYRPLHPIVMAAAKSNTGIRHLHLLHPEDLILYTSLTLLIKDDIEASRIPSDVKRVYSYRADDCDHRLYATTRHLHDDYIERLKFKAEKGPGFVGIVDIADFYTNVSQRKLTRLLVETASSDRNAQAARLLVLKFARSLMAHKDKGIPTGPYASRVLAEALLNDIDRYLVSKDLDFVRWVDDFNIFTQSASAAQRAIFELSMWLYKEHDLSLQSTKTHILDIEDYNNYYLLRPKDRIADTINVLHPLLSSGDDEDQDEVDDFRAMELLEMIVGAIADQNRVDYGVVNFAARKLQQKRLDEQTSGEILEVLIENLEHLIPAIEDVARLISTLLPRTMSPRRNALRLLESARNSVVVDHYATWILTIFWHHDGWGCADELLKFFDGTKSDAVQHYAGLALARSGRSGRLRQPPFLRQGSWSGWRW